MKVEGLLVKYNERDLPENFVSVAVFTKNMIATHAGLLIRHQKKDYLYHFPGTPPVIETEFEYEEMLIYKILDSFDTEDESDVGAFLQHCKRICNNTQIMYGYIHDGSSYNNDGVFVSNTGLPEISTCVGFCINTLTNAIIDAGDSLFHLDDWQDAEVLDWVDAWSIKQLQKKYKDLDWSLFNAFKKRILPIELLASTFLSEFPIRKDKIEALIPEVELAILEKNKSHLN